MQQGLKFFENRKCRYFPCHKGLKEFNCLFCFCPLYLFKDCPGTYRLTEKGLKDCTPCLFPHKPENYDAVMDFLKRKIEKNTFL
jgi:Zn-finger protein